MAISPDQLAERDAAKAEDATAAAAQQAANDALAAAQAHAAECETHRQQTQARLKAADAAILAGMTEGEIRGVNPGDIPVLLCKGGALIEGTLYSLHSDPPAQ